MVRLFRPPIALMAGLIVALAVAGCSAGDGESAVVPEVATVSIEVTSPAFTEGSPIGARYTCDAENVSPPLRWSGVPSEAMSIALIADDPDAPRGTWVHWVLYGIPPDVGELLEGVPSQDVLANGAKHGETDFARRE